MNEITNKIITKKQLLEWIRLDQNISYLKYRDFFSKKTIPWLMLFIMEIIGCDSWNLLYLYYLRKEEYHKNNGRKIRKTIFFILKRRLGRKSMLEIAPNTVGPGLKLSHYGSRIINGETRIGRNASIHSDVQIGKTDTGTPVIGNDVYIGPGVKMYGKIEIANGIKIGANALVNKSFTEEGVTIAGVPAKIVSR